MRSVSSMLRDYVVLVCIAMILALPGNVQSASNSSSNNSNNSSNNNKKNSTKTNSTNATAPPYAEGVLIENGDGTYEYIPPGPGSISMLATMSPARSPPAESDQTETMALEQQTQQQVTPFSGAVGTGNGVTSYWAANNGNAYDRSSEAGHGLVRKQYLSKCGKLFTADRRGDEGCRRLRMPTRRHEMLRGLHVHEEETESV